MKEQNLFGDLDELRNTLFQEQEYVKEELDKVVNRIEKSEETRAELEARLDRLSQALNRLPEKEEDQADQAEPEPDSLPEEEVEEKTDEKKASEVFADPPDVNPEEGEELPF